MRSIISLGEDSVIMLDYQLQSNSRRCSVTGRILKPGERFYTVLLDEDGKYVRREQCEEAWQGPPENAFSYWTGIVPESEKEQKPTFDDDTLMECFTRLEGEKEPSRVQFRYVLALLLMRRKKLRFEEVVFRDDQEVLRLKQPRSKVVHEVINPDLTEERIESVQDEVFRVLGW